MPLVFSFAASLEGLTPQELLASPTKLSNGLRTVFASLGVDGVAGWCDDTACAATLSCTLDWYTYPPAVVEAPPPEAVPDLGAIGAAGATGVATEVLRRLGSLLPDTVLVGTMPGPVTLARHLSGTRSSEETPAEILERARGAAKACLAYAKTLGDAGLDVLLVREEDLLVPGEDISAGDIARLYSSIWNTARFYGLAAMLTLGGGVARDADDAASAPRTHAAAALMALAPVVDGVVAPPALLEECRDALKGFKRIGLALPADLPARPADVIGAYLREYAVADQVRDGRLFLLTTEGEVSPDVDRAALIVGLETIRDHVKGEVAHGA
ncbi:MAG: hypothetical protein ACYC33_12215 [Thermoleophilia bacterium]